MSTPNTDGLQTLIDQGKMKVGNPMLPSSGATPLVSQLPYVDSSGNVAIASLNASTPVYINSSSVPVSGALPFALQLSAGATDTSFSAASITGSATGSADELMHLTLVKGANATAVIAGYYRVTVTDNAGVITSGAYYAPFYVLS